MTCNHWTDEVMIDLILGKLDIQQATNIRECIENCDHCRSQYLDWRKTMPEEISIQPSSILKARVMKNYKKSLRKKRIFAPSLAWKLMGVAIVVLALSLTFFQNVDVNPELAMHEEDTSVYEIVSSPNIHTSGYVMVNNRTEEFYLTVDGLLPIVNKDYQAWIKTHNGFQDVGILTLENGKGQIYLKKQPVERVDYILMSIEPKGGSSSPTEEHSYLIKLIAK